MTPDTPANLGQFIAAVELSSAFYLLPAVMVNGVPEMIRDLAILKHRFHVKNAADVGAQEVEMIALRQRNIAS